jgi:hypothetical protein
MGVNVQEIFNLMIMISFKKWWLQKISCHSGMHEWHLVLTRTSAALYGTSVANIAAAAIE